MKLEIEFENQEDLRKKLSYILPDPIILNIRPCYTVEEIKNVLNYMMVFIKTIILTLLETVERLQGQEIMKRQLLNYRQ